MQMLICIWLSFSLNERRFVTGDVLIGKAHLSHLRVLKLMVQRVTDVPIFTVRTL